MNFLHLSPKVLTIVLFFLLFLPSCNNEEIFIIEESAIIAEESIEEPIEEDEPNTEDEAPPIDTVDDNVTTIENTSVDIEAHLNDKNLPTAITISNTNPSNGVLTINNNDTPNNFIDDSVVYKSNVGFSGIDSFEYTVCDAANSENCDTAIVTITVEPLEIPGDTFDGELKAFPSAYGAGANTTGGRGGTVIHVTNLTNNNSQGSFRWALKQKYPRIIVFDVSGTIDLGGSKEFISGADYSNLTIAGQTAPEGGITLTNGAFYFERVNNIILRYIKFRGGYSRDELDALSMPRGSDYIVDHCEGWYGRDEGLDLSDKDSGTLSGNVTVQNCLIAECKTGLMLGDAQTEAYEPVASIRNLFVNVGHRFPKYAGQGHLDIINNGVHNWGSRLMRFDPANFTINEIGNYYQSGSGSAGRVDAWYGLQNIRTFNGMSLEIYTNDNYVSPDHLAAIKNHSDNDPWYPGNGWTPWYSHEKILEYNTDNRYGWTRWHDNAAIPINPEWFVTSALPIAGYAPPILPIAQVKQHLVDNVGARHYLNADGSVGEYLDNLQTKYLGYFANDSDVGRLDYESEYGQQATNVPSNTRPAGYDTDNDGMADIWEAGTFGDLTQDSNGDFDGDGYTNIEEFTNLVDK